MEILNIPAEYASAYGELLYSFRSDGNGCTVEAEILGGADNIVLGAKRFRTDGDFTVNIAPFIRKLLVPEPGSSPGFGFRADPGKLAEGTVRIGSLMAGKRNFSASLGGLSDGNIMTKMPSRRAIGYYEYEEISIASKSGTFSVSVKADGLQEISYPVQEYDFTGGVCTFCVDMATVTEYIEASGLDPLTFNELRIGLSRNGSLLSEFTYLLREYAPGAVRLCWLNSMGGLDSFTFQTMLSSAREVKKERACSIDGYTVVSMRAERIIELNSGYQPTDVLEALAEIISSPKVWRFAAGGDYIPVDILSDSTSYNPSSLESLSIKIRDTKPSVIKNL